MNCQNTLTKAINDRGKSLVSNLLNHDQRVLLVRRDHNLILLAADAQKSEVIRGIPVTDTSPRLGNELL